MSDVAYINRQLTPAQILAYLLTVDGPGSGLTADIVVTPRIGGSFGGYPSITASIAQPTADPSATLARFSLGN